MNNLLTLTQYLASKQQKDLLNALEPYDNSGLSVEHLEERLTQFIPTTTLFKLAIKHEDQMLLNEALWRDMLWSFKLHLRNAKALDEIAILPFHGSRLTRDGAKILVSLTYVDDQFNSVIATELKPDGFRVSTHYETFTNAAQQTFALGFREESDIDTYNRLEEEYSSVYPQTTKSYHFKGEGLSPNSTNLENLWRNLYRKFVIDRCPSDMPQQLQRQEFVRYVQHNLVQHGIDDHTGIFMPLNHWLFIYNEYTSTTEGE